MYICSQCLLRSPRSTQLLALTQEPGVRIWSGQTTVVRRRVRTAINPRTRREQSSTARLENEGYIGDIKNVKAGQFVHEPKPDPHGRLSRFYYPKRRESSSSTPPSREGLDRDITSNNLDGGTRNSHIDTSSPDRKRQSLHQRSPRRNQASREGTGSFRVALSERIRLKARLQHRRLDDRQFDREFELRFLSLYPWSVIHRKWRRTFMLHWENKRDAKSPEVIWKDLPFKENEVSLWVKEMVPRQDTDISFMTKGWRKLPQGEKSKRWPFIIQWLLRRSPRDAVKFLDATNHRPRPPFLMAADCFRYLEAFHHDELTSDPEFKSYYYRVLYSCLKPEIWPMDITGGGLRVFFNHCSHKTLSRGFSQILWWDIRVSADALLRFMDSFAKFKDVENALQALRLAMEQTPGPDLRSKVVLNRICNLIKLDEVVDIGGARNFKILPKILEMGVQPDRDMMNLIMSNALRCGSSKVGWDIAHYMKDQGFPFDSYTYVSLMKDAVARRDVDKLVFIFRELDKNKDIRKDPYVTSQSLHALFTLSRKQRDPDRSHSDTFARMLEIYSKSHDLTPLLDLSIISPDYIGRDQGSTTPPSKQSLTIMIAAYLRKLEHPARGGETFDRFQQLVNQGHGTFAPLAESDYIYNVFLMSFVRSARTIPNCVEVVERMLQPLPPTAVVKDDGSRPICQAKPTIRTWTILLSAFMFRENVHGAEKIKALMAKYEVEFNDYTWNVMTTGYAKSQMVNETAATLRARDKDKVLFDSHTIQAVRKLREEKLREVLHILGEEMDEDLYK